MSINAISTNDFNKQLYMMMAQEKEVIDNENENVCLITNNKLTDNFVKLCCNHKFNYEAIFNEVKKQKVKYNHLEVTRLKKHQIKCPYCRTIQNGLLPLVEGFEKIRYVNYPEALQHLPNKCTYIFASGKKKGQFCGKSCSKKYCTTHEKIMLKREQKLLEKNQKQLTKQLLKEQKILEKKHKQLLNKNKKLKEKIENYKIKLPKNDPMIDVIDNMINEIQNSKFLGSNIKTNQEINKETTQEIKQEKEKINIYSCQYIYKKGKNKGLQCHCKKIFKDGLCKTHYKMKLKQENKLKEKLEKINPQIPIKNVKIKKKKTIIHYIK